jgi:hypothetical protein
MTDREDGEEENPLGHLQDFLRFVETHNRQVEDQNEMGTAAGNIRLRRFIEDLDPERLETLQWLLSVPASMPARAGHRVIATLYGMVIAEGWRRNPLGDLTGLEER